MITVKPEGRLANNLFQYTFGRLIHESTGLALNYTVNTKIFKTPILQGRIGTEEKVVITDYFDTFKESVVDLKFVNEAYKNKNILLHGFFQNKSYFNHRRQDVKKWLGEIPVINSNWTGIHIRKTDYKPLGWDLTDEYYEKCLNLANPENLMIFTDEPENHYVKILMSRGAKIVDASPEESMYLLGTCGKIIISRSTFSWWSAFLSSPSKVFYPRPLVGWWSVKDTPTKVIEVDSSEYHYVDF